MIRPRERLAFELALLVLLSAALMSCAHLRPRLDCGLAWQAVLAIPAGPARDAAIAAYVDDGCKVPEAPSPVPSPSPTPGPTPSPAPTPTPGPTSAPSPSPEPGPSGCLPPPVEPLEDWGPSFDPGARPSHLIAPVMAARDEVGERCGQDPKRTIEAVAAILRAKGYCAGFGKDDLSIRSEIDLLWEEWHLVFYGDGCWTGTPYKGAHTYLKPWPPAGPGPTPTPAPTPQPTSDEALCLSDGRPLPPRVFADTGEPHWEYRAKPHGPTWMDSTEVVVKACDFCEAIGMGRMGDGSLRCSCPTRPDPPAGREDLFRARVGCENYLRGGPRKYEASPAGRVVVKDDNPAQFTCEGGSGCQQVRVCGADGRVCSGWLP